MTYSNSIHVVSIIVSNIFKRKIRVTYCGCDNRFSEKSIMFPYRMSPIVGLSMPICSCVAIAFLFRCLVKDSEYYTLPLIELIVHGNPVPEKSLTHNNEHLMTRNIK